MPGSTDNTDLLSAQNQTIQALNDIQRACGNSEIA